MHDERHLDWGDCWNARDLGGLPLEGGGRTAWKSVIRASSLHVLTDEDWEAVVDYGVRRIVDLRHDEQCERHPYRPPPSIERVQVPIERDLLEDPEFAEWADKGWIATPLYYPGFLERWPERAARAVEVVANADEGGVVHCSAGKDRTGLIVSLILSVVGVRPSSIAEDHHLSRERLETETRRRAGEHNDNPGIEKVLDRAGTTYRRALLEFIEPLAPRRALLDAGLSEEDIEALRDRLRPPDDR